MENKSLSCGKAYLVKKDKDKCSFLCWLYCKQMIFHIGTETSDKQGHTKPGKHSFWWLGFYNWVAIPPD